MTDPLVAYLQRSAARPFAWGTADCFLLVADWILARRGVDVAAQVRGRYHDEESAQAWIGGFGGLPLWFGRQMRRAGFPLTREAERGDVGVILVGGLARCAIRGDATWATMLDGSLALVAFTVTRPVAAWRI